MALATLCKSSSSSSSHNGHTGTLWGWLVWNGSSTLPAVPLRSVERGYVATVGRHPNNNIVIPATLADNYLFKHISRNHCTLERAVDDDVTVVLCLSGNGTFVDGERVPHLRKLQLHHGSLVSLCSADSTITFNYYDSSYSYLGYHRELNSKFFVLNVESSGAYGEVCKVIVTDTCAIAAVKTVHTNTRGSPFASDMVNPRGVSSLRNEIICLSQLEHPCIVKMFDSADQWPANRMFIAMEFLGGGELQQRMYNCNYLSEMNTKFFFVQMVSAIKYCHGCSPPIVHRNLFPHNVLLASNDILTPIKIADFGLARQMTCPTSLTLCCGAELYIAPEMRRHLDDDDADPYTPAVDIWSLGVMLHYMLFGRHPACARAHLTGHSTSTEQYGLPSNGLPPYEGASKAYCETVSKRALSLIDGMLTIDAGLRHSLEDVIGCQWLRDEDTLTQLRERVFRDTPIFF